MAELTEEQISTLMKLDTKVAVHNWRLDTLEKDFVMLRVGQNEILSILKDGLSQRIVSMETLMRTFVEDKKAGEENKKEGARNIRSILIPLAVDTVRTAIAVVIVLAVIHLPQITPLVGIK